MTTANFYIFFSFHSWGIGLNKPSIYFNLDFSKLYGFLRFFLKGKKVVLGIFVGIILYKCQYTKRVACTFEWQHIMGDPWKKKYKQNSLDPKLKKNLTYTKALQLQLKT